MQWDVTDAILYLLKTKWRSWNRDQIDRCYSRQFIRDVASLMAPMNFPAQEQHILSTDFMKTYIRDIFGKEELQQRYPGKEWVLHYDATGTR